MNPNVYWHYIVCKELLALPCMIAQKSLHIYTYDNNCIIS